MGIIENQGWTEKKRVILLDVLWMVKYLNRIQENGPIVMTKDQWLSLNPEASRLIIEAIEGEGEGEVKVHDC